MSSLCWAYTCSLPCVSMQTGSKCPSHLQCKIDYMYKGIPSHILWMHFLFVCNPYFLVINLIFIYFQDKLCKNLGFPLDVSSSGALQRSLLRYNEGDGSIWTKSKNLILTYLCFKPMQVRVITC